MFMRKPKSYTVLYVLLAVLVVMLGCGDSAKHERSIIVNSEYEPANLLNQLIREGRVVVATRNSPTTYYIGPEGAKGFEHDLVKAFADSFGLEVEFIIKDNVVDVIEAVRSGEAHIGAAGVTVTESRNKLVSFGASYLSVRQQVVCHRQGPLPRSVEDLVGIDLQIVAGTSYEEQLTQLKTEYPGLTWSSDYERTIEELLAQVADREVGCTVADSNSVKINQRYYPDLAVAMALTEGQEIAWVMPADAERLAEAQRFWFERFTKAGQFVVIHDRYYGHYEIFDYVNIRAFHRRIRQRLPKYRKLFEEAGEKNDIPWTTLAAQSYQESHWNPRAKSPTGVRGLMMLTLSTARAMGYKSRLSPENSVMGGARYLKKLISRVSPNVKPEERIWFALAAYNVGMGHIHDAQLLAHELGKNPYEWRELKTVLPLLSQKKYYKKLKYGYARGTEPVRYVQRIREFKDILDQQTTFELEILGANDPSQKL